MDLVFGHAIYGEHERGHRLLGASPSFPAARTLAGRMDMQGTPPPHINWQPYLSAFAWNDHYVFARTMPDQNAARPGMVFSRAFAFPTESLAKLDDILGMIELLEALGDARDAPQDVAYQAAPGRAVQDAGLIRALLAHAPSPVIWPGQDGFEQALAGLWQSLWPAARQALSVRLAFSPTDIGADPPTLVTTPPTLLTRWSGFTIVRPDPGGALANSTEKYLAGVDRSDLQKALVDAFGDTTPAIRDVRQLVELEGSLGKGATLADYLDALRLTGHLGRKTSKGEAIKQTLIENSVAAMANASAAEIRMARNLDLASFKTRSAFWAALSRWAQEKLFAEREPALVGLVIADAFSGKPKAEWGNAIAKGLGAALTRPAGALAGQLWSVILARPELLSPVAKTLTSAKLKTLEAALVARTLVTIDSAVLDKILIEVRGLNFIQLHAACCAAGLPPIAAIRRHLIEVDATADSVKLAARKAKGSELLAAALEHNDDITLALAGEAAASSPTLLKRLDISLPRWRGIWRVAIAKDARAAMGPSDPGAATAALLEGLIEGSIADLPLVTALGTTSLADLSHVADRERLWQRLPEPSRSAYLQATANGWLNAVERGDTVTAEPALAQYLASPTLLEPVLTQLAPQPSVGCALFRALPQLDEARFSRWLREVLRRVNPLTPDDAEALGRFVASRSWESTARALADAITGDGRADLRPSVDFIVDLIGAWRRYDLDEWGSSMPLSAKWQVLEEVTVDLYGYGPGDTRLWQRAGGKDKDIPKGKSGAETWHNVFADAKKGKNAVDVRELIKCMYEDYSHHSALRKLRWDSSFGMKR